MTVRRSDLEELGFTGFVPFADLPTAEVPLGSGVYAVLRPASERPTFLGDSPADRFKGRDPSVTQNVLQRKWVADADVIYIGKAAMGSNGRRGLRKRLDEYRKHGAGDAKAAHWGGRYIWQLADSNDLLVAWLPTPDEDPEVIEARLIGVFRGATASLPFANLKQGRRSNPLRDNTEQT